MHRPAVPSSRSQARGRYTGSFSGDIDFSVELSEYLNKVQTYVYKVVDYLLSVFFGGIRIIHRIDDDIIESY